MLQLRSQPKSPVVELLTLAIPTVFQMASYTVMQFIDTLMLSRIGATEATAGGNAGLFAFSIVSFGVGLLLVVNTLASQAFGRNEPRDCGRYLWQGIWFSFFAGLALLPALPFGKPFFASMGHAPELAAAEAVYLRIVLMLMAVKLLGTAMGQFLLATDRPRQVLLATIGGVSTNALAAWVMIFGHFGLPRMGIAGSAWGQNVGMILETSMLLFFVLRSPYRQKYHLADWKLRKTYMTTLLRIGAPAGAQLIADVLAWSLFGMWVMAQFGTRAMAAHTFMLRYMVVSFMPAFGVGSAVTALVGRYIGRGQPDVAAQRARLGFQLTALYMVTCGLLFFVARRPLIGLFTSDPEILRIGAMLLVFAAVYQFFDALYIIYNGALRGAGDTFVPAVATALLCWGIIVFGGYTLARLAPQFGPAGPWTLASVYGVILGLFMYRRFARGNWRRIHLEQQPTADTVPALNLS
jgi:MATE family multidrug resistance protein